jgi:hypothetical protein
MIWNRFFPTAQALRAAMRCYYCDADSILEIRIGKHRLRTCKIHADDGLDAYLEYKKGE